MAFDLGRLLCRELTSGPQSLRKGSIRMLVCAGHQV